MKRLLLFCFLPVLLLLAGCRQDPLPGEDNPAIEVIEGETMGTYYRVSLLGEAPAGLQASLDSLLVAFNLEVSTYIDSSRISRFNQAAEGLELTEADSHFIANYELAMQIARQSAGAFEPTVMPLVNYWGFGYTPKKPVTDIDSIAIDSLLELVGYEKVELQQQPDGSRFLAKAVPGVQLDFSALAKGYGVDLLARFLSRKGYKNYLVDIGGELAASGDKGNGRPWTVGINVPLEDAEYGAVERAFPLRNRAVATSGNYRNFHEVDGRKYGHTINPKTGFPERTVLLSASIFAPDCATADAFATTCMVLGAEKGMELIESIDHLDAYFIISTSDGGMRSVYTEGLRPLIEVKE